MAVAPSMDVHHDPVVTEQIDWTNAVEHHVGGLRLYCEADSAPPLMHLPVSDMPARQRDLPLEQTELKVVAGELISAFRTHNAL